METGVSDCMTVEVRTLRATNMLQMLNAITHDICPFYVGMSG